MHKAGGSSRIWALISASTIGLVVLVGWRLYEGSKTNKTAQNDTTQQQISDKTQNSTEQSYFTINELGIQMRVADKSKTYTYRYSSDSNDPIDSAMIFSPQMKTVDDANVNCKGDNLGAIGIIQRSKDAYAFSKGEQALAIDNVRSFQLGDDYFVFSTLQHECSENESIGTRRSVEAQSFEEVFKSIQLIK